MIYLFLIIYIFLCYHRKFNWCLPWRSSRFIFLFLFRRHLTLCHPWRYSRFYLFRCLHLNFTWQRPRISSRFSCLCIHPCSCCLLLLLTCGVSMRSLWAPLLWFLFHLTTLSIMPVGLLLSAPLVIMLNNSARFYSVVWSVSLIFAKGASGVGCSNSSTKSRASIVAASEDDTLVIFTFWG